MPKSRTLLHNNINLNPPPSTRSTTIIKSKQKFTSTKKNTTTNTTTTTTNNDDVYVDVIKSKDDTNTNNTTVAHQLTKSKIPSIKNVHVQLEYEMLTTTSCSNSTSNDKNNMDAAADVDFFTTETSTTETSTITNNNNKTDSQMSMKVTLNLETRDCNNDNEKNELVFKTLSEIKYLRVFYEPLVDFPSSINNQEESFFDLPVPTSSTVNNDNDQETETETETENEILPDPKILIDTDVKNFSQEDEIDIFEMFPPTRVKISLIYDSNTLLKILNNNIYKSKNNNNNDDSSSSSCCYTNGNVLELCYSVNKISVAFYGSGKVFRFSPKQNELHRQIVKSIFPSSPYLYQQEKDDEELVQNQNQNQNLNTRRGGNKNNDVVQIKPTTVFETLFSMMNIVNHNNIPHFAPSSSSSSDNNNNKNNCVVSQLLKLLPTTEKNSNNLKNNNTNNSIFFRTSDFPIKLAKAIYQYARIPLIFCGDQIVSVLKFTSTTRNNKKDDHEKGKSEFLNVTFQHEEETCS